MDEDYSRVLNQLKDYLLVETMFTIRQLVRQNKMKRKKRGNRVYLVATPPLPVMPALMSPCSFDRTKGKFYFLILLNIWMKKEKHCAGKEKSKWV